MAKHYDVVVLGSSIGALAAAALLARRSWRVLVLGQGHRPASYSYDGHALSRRAFTFLAVTSPAWSRILVELAQSQTFRRRVEPIEPLFQILAKGVRLDVPSDPAAFAKEIDREFPEVRRVVDELYAELARTSAAADVAFDRDVVWPPGGFWEKREVARLTSAVPHVTDANEWLLAELPRDHAYRAVVGAPARFSSHACEPPPFATARLHGAWARGVQRLSRGEDELAEFLLERVRASGGDVRLGDRAVAIEHRGGKVAGVVLDGDDAPTGVQFVVSDLPARTLLELANGFAPTRRALAALPRLSAGDERFVVSLVVRNEGIPAPLGPESFLLDLARPRVKAHEPDVHLQRLPGAQPGTTLLVAEALLPRGGTLRVEAARDAVLRVIEEKLPFVERHYVLVDSVHDGRPLWDYRSGARRSIDRALLRARGGSPDPEPMEPRWLIDPPSLYGLAGEPIRTPLSGAFLAGATPLPALGQEGELLAAWSAARLITKTDRQKEKMRRELWSKVELG